MSLAHKAIPALFQKCAWAPLRLCMRAFARMKIQGEEHVRHLDRNVIFASNHTSQLDPLLLVAALPFSSAHLPLIFASREKSYYECKGWEHLVYGGTFFRLMGAHPMYGGLKDYEASLRHHLSFARSGRSICVFPTRLAREPINEEARGGVAYLALSTQTPIITVNIRGVADLTFGTLMRGRHEVIVTFGKPLHPEDIENLGDSSTESSRYSAIARALMRKIDELPGAI